MLDESGDCCTMTLGIRPPVEQITLTGRITESLLIMLPVDVDEGANLVGETTDRHRLIVDAGNRTTLGIDLAHRDAVAPL